MPNMKTKGQSNLKLLGGQEKTDGRTAGRTAGRTDKLIPVNPLTILLCGDIKIVMFFLVIVNFFIFCNQFSMNVP
jgi:hypothetical protein